jgi:hypothetical protein
VTVTVSGLQFTGSRRRAIPPATRITEVTRRRLLEGLDERRTVWSGVLDDVEFLGRLYDLDALPSSDPRFRSARSDILQHRVANPLDWDDDWIFPDPRFGLADSDDALLRFLAEMLHPAVRTDPAEVGDLRTFFNSVLIHDGYEIAQTGDISGAPLFEGRRTGSGVRGLMKNLIFAAVGPKPEIVIDDAVNNDLRIVKNEQNCLIYDRPLAAHGLTWRDLAAWWADREKLTVQPERAIWSSLYRRLLGQSTRETEPSGASSPPTGNAMARLGPVSRPCSRRCTCTTTRTPGPVTSRAPRRHFPGSAWTSSCSCPVGSGWSSNATASSTTQMTLARRAHAGTPR